MKTSSYIQWMVFFILTSFAGAAPPSISRHPSSVCVVQGQLGSMTVTVQGTMPLQYQWRFNGTELPGQTNRTLNVRTVQPENGGDYQVMVSNSEGSLTSLPARLHVLPNPTNLLARVFTNSTGQKLPYRLWVPTNHLAKGPLPLVIFLHGAGEAGTDNISQVRVQPHFLSFVSYQNQDRYPCFVVAPQTPSTTLNWGSADIINRLDGLRQQLIQTYPIDTNRLYLTGLSMGGYGTWALIMTTPDLFAAAAPVCGGGSANYASLIKNIPIWNFHSADDSTVSVSESRTMIDAIRRAGGNPAYTEYANAGHGSWVPAYSTPHLIDWMMAQRRGNLSQGDPRVTVPLTSTNGILRAQAGYFDLHGQASLFGTAITNVTWTNLTLRAGGKAVGTEDWSVSDLTLGEKSTNLVMVLAKAASDSPQYGGITTLSKTMLIRGITPLRLVMRQEADRAELSWTGGEPPYIIQHRSDLVLDQWSEVLTNATSPMQVPPGHSALFYRVVCP